MDTPIDEVRARLALAASIPVHRVHSGCGLLADPIELLTTFALMPIHRYFAMLVSIGLLTAASAQRTDLRLTAAVRCWEKNDDSTRFTITALDTSAGAIQLKAECSAKGKCRIDLPLDHVYRVELSGEGHVPKHVVIDLNGPGIKQRKWGYSTRFTVKLMPRIDSVDYSVCERPLSKAHFDKKTNEFVWDEQYTFDLTPYYETMENRYTEVVLRRRGKQP
jgi:hypothetical protein